jgi:hypothetical protein
MSLKNLGFLVENEINAKILSAEGSSGIRGNLSVKYFPTDDTGTGEPDEELMPEESPDELLGKAITFRVEIDQATGLPKDLSKNVFVTYALNFDRKRVYQTPEVESKGQNPSFGYKQVHHVDAVTPSILRYLDKGQLCFKVFGYPDFEAARIASKKDIDASKKEETKKDAVKQQALAKNQIEAQKQGLGGAASIVKTTVRTVDAEGKEVVGIRVLNDLDDKDKG